MPDLDLQRMIDSVKRGRLSRRGFIQRMAALGLSAPLASQVLAMGGVAMAAPADQGYQPTKRGGGGTLKLLWWQGPTLLNPHFAVGTKDQDGSYLFYEPLAIWDADGNLVPVLATEAPSRENGQLAADGKSVVWKLKQGVKWHDGKPFSADDCVFNWEYAKDPQTATVTLGSYKDVKVEKIDDYTIKVSFEKPTPFWADAFVGAAGLLIPKHIFGQYTGSKSRQAPANLAPVGTGPYKFKSFEPGALVIGDLNPDYHQPNRPYFDSVQMKGGGEAVSAARAVLQTGEFDFAWNLQVKDEILKKLEKGGKGHVDIYAGSSIEHVQLNRTDPNKEVDGQKSSIKTQHPTFSDPAVREAMSLLMDKDSMQKYIYGRTGKTTANFVNGPSRFVSHNTSWEFNIKKAIEILDKAGYKPGSDGIRAKNGNRMDYVFQTSINQPRQETQEIIKQACMKAGIGIEIKAVLSSVFFSSDAGNPNIYPKFYADMQMYTTNPGRPDPGKWIQQFLSEQVAQKENKWQGRNITRWQNTEYDKTWHESENEMDPVKRAALLIKCNDLVIKDIVVIPVTFRMNVAASAKSLRTPPLSGWDNDCSNVANWYKVESA